MTADDVAFTFELLRKNIGLKPFGLPLAGATAPTKTQAVVTFLQAVVSGARRSCRNSSGRESTIR
jgi:hypothetical protein